MVLETALISTVFIERNIKNDEVTGHYNSKVPGTNMRVRDMVNKMSYEKQREYGIKTLKKFGWKQ